MAISNYNTKQNMGKVLQCRSVGRAEEAGFSPWRMKRLLEQGVQDGCQGTGSSVSIEAVCGAGNSVSKA